MLIVVLLAVNGQAQNSAKRDFEVGTFVGFSHYNGDLNPWLQFGSGINNFAGGVALRKNMNRRYALRLNLFYGKVQGEDALINSEYQNKRNLQFSSTVFEASTQIEFNFLPFDALDRKSIFTPYVFIGFGMFRFNPVAQLQSNSYELIPLNTENQKYSRVQPVIPFGTGIKLKLSHRILTSFEWGVRKTFTDYLDDVSGSYPLEAEIEGLSADLSDRSIEQVGPDGTNWGTQRGNSQNKDWYTYAGVVITIRLGVKKDACKTQERQN